MIIHTEETVRTEVENTLLREMVIEDNQFLILGECDELDYMVDDPDPSSDSIFDSDNEDDDEFLSIDIDDIMSDDDYIIDDLI